jgi:uroporphyrinogen-III decarboxylase
MPRGGHFFDSIIRQPPIDEERLNPEDNLEEFGPVSAEYLVHLEEAVAYAASTGRGVMLGLPGTGLGDIALVPAPFLKYPKGIRDVSEWYISTRTRRDYIHAVFERQTRIALGNLERIKAVAGDAVDAVFVCGTDFGTQTSSFCSEATFRELYMPYYGRINAWIRQHTRWKTFKHSCGSVVRFLGAFIESGFDILNPVQCSAAGMDPEHLKSTYGDKLVFWGGGVDTQKTLPFETPAQVREQVLRRCEVFARNGGFVFNSIHNIQAGTPIANIVAMRAAVAEFNGR